MVSSTEIPNALLKTSRVEGLSGIPNHPMIPPVNNNGMMFGTIEITTIRHDLNKIAIKIPIQIMAKIRLVTRFFTKYLVPSDATTEVPVNVTSKYSF